MSGGPRSDTQERWMHLRVIEVGVEIHRVEVLLHEVGDKEHLVPGEDV